MDKKLLDMILELEWEMFSSVRNFGQSASCQADNKTFRVMRFSQKCEWPEELLASYYEDLLAARSEGRNLMSEKYAWMMESNFSEEYKSIAHLLPVINRETSKRIEEIVAQNVEWKLALCGEYPKLTGRGRPIHSSEDSRYETSFETYLRGELKTYSPRTIVLLHEFTMRQQAEDINGVERSLFNQMRQYGYATLKQAEDNL